MKISIQALELILSPEEMKKRVPPEKLNEIEGKGILQAYTLAHEGTSHPKVLGEGSQILKWPRAVIRRLAEKIKAGTKFLIGHGEGTNAHDGRESVGEVLASFVKEISGKLANVVIGHFPDKAKVDPYDVCSMEADVHTEDDVVGDITDVTGIALGNSDRDNPAFSGALRLASVQCFAKEDTKPGEGDHKVTFEEIKKAVKDMMIWPHQLFELKDIQEDRTFGTILKGHSTLKAENERLSKANTEMEATNKDAIRKTQISDSKGKLDTLMADGYTDKQRSFIKDRFDPEKAEDLSDDGMKKYLEAAKEDFAKTAKLFGAEETPKKPGSGDDEGDMVDQAMKIIGAVD